jgi:hypothetical protein
MNKEQNMINITVDAPTHKAYVRIDTIDCPMGPIGQSFQVIKATRAVWNIAIMDRDSRSSGMCSPSNMTHVCGLKEAKEFVESFRDNLIQAYEQQKPMVLTSASLIQEDLELLVSVIMFYSNCRYSIHLKP